MPFFQVQSILESYRFGCRTGTAVLLRLEQVTNAFVQTLKPPTNSNFVVERSGCAEEKET